MPRLWLRALLPLLLARPALAHEPGPFEPIDPKLPTPSTSRLGSGHPGPTYWQQRADYDIEARLDEVKRSVEGRVRIRYTNASPHALSYLWLHLDNNIFARDSAAALAAKAPGFRKMSFESMARQLSRRTFNGALVLDTVKDSSGQPLPHRVVDTLMRLDPPQPVAAGETFSFEISWHYTLNDATVIKARTGYEPFDDGHDIFEVAHWYPRMAAYSELRGWHNDQFLGRGEFTLEFGDYNLRLTVPADHVVAATGVLQNPEEVLSGEEQARFKRARTAKKPVYVVTPAEAKAKAKTKKKPKGTRTWIFSAHNVRDVAWASSRKFIWDAMGVAVPEENRTVLAMSYYPNEAEPLWNQYSTRAVAHTLDVYGRHAFPYPYPVAISVNGPVGGMEYPMISFNAPRPKDDGTYFAKSGKERPWRNTKYGLISVVIHEVGHNWFPMIVNTDERRWTWMDEGLNTFLQFIAEQEWEEGYPSRRGFAEDITGYMSSRNQVPIMSTSESLLQFGNNAYAKPATALNVLRETVLGREIFDDAFRRYARAWKFRRPLPGDFFRIMEDASGLDLDWFWSGWFYSTDHVDIAIGAIEEYELDTRDPRIDKPEKKKARDEEPKNITEIRNEGRPRLVQRIESLKDFYNSYDDLDVNPGDVDAYEKYLKDLDEDEKALLTTTKRFFVVELINRGGLVMPVPLEVSYEDGTSELLRLPVDIWRRAPKRTRKLLVTNQAIVKLRIDPFLELADTNPLNNSWPAEIKKTRFELFKEKTGETPMKKAQDAKKKKKKKAKAK